MHNGGHFLLQHTRLRNSQVIIAARNNLISGIPPWLPLPVAGLDVLNGSVQDREIYSLIHSRKDA